MMRVSLLIPVFCLFCQCSKPSGRQTNTTVYVEDDEDRWYGPGFYYGIWFDDEGGYNNWHHNHWNHDQHGNHPHYHGGGHGGHGGGHGDGHH